MQFRFVGLAVGLALLLEQRLSMRMPWVDTERPSASYRRNRLMRYFV